MMKPLLNETHLKTSSALQSANICSIAWRVGQLLFLGIKAARMRIVSLFMESNLTHIFPM